MIGYWSQKVLELIWINQSILKDNMLYQMPSMFLSCRLKATLTDRQALVHKSVATFFTRGRFTVVS